MLNELLKAESLEQLQAEQLCGKSFSRSSASEMWKTLSVAVEEFRNRPLDAYPFLDATRFRVRENRRIVHKALFIALATTGEGRREVVGFRVYDRESEETWRDFLRGLKACDLKGLLWQRRTSMKVFVRLFRGSFRVFSGNTERFGSFSHTKEMSVSPF